MKSEHQTGDELHFHVSSETNTLQSSGLTLQLYVPLSTQESLQVLSFRGHLVFSAPVEQQPV